MSWQNRFSAVMRWTRPRSIVSHSLAGTMRGTRSKGKIFDAALVAVDGEGDALVAERDVRHLPAALERADAEHVETLGNRGVVRPGFPRRDEHLVVQAVDVVLLKHEAFLDLSASPEAR